MREIRLLDVLSSLSGLMISDLRFEENKKRVAHYLRQIKPDDFPLSEWNELARYIFMDRTLTFNAITELLMYFDNC